MESKTAWPETLIGWYRSGHRDLPWRATKDPYRIWISEIMLQQTRAAAVIPYYKRFLLLFPTVYDLAECREQDLLKAWEGLGYYSRARNLQKTARILVSSLGGMLPGKPEELRKLPGIGAYTAGAIAAIAFGYPCAAVDGNFLRVWARLFSLEEPVDRPDVKKRITEEANALCMRLSDPGAFANAMMELGAMVCLPKTPVCTQCPLSKICRASCDGTWGRYPIRLPKRERRTEKRDVFLVSDGQRVAVARRDETLLAGMYGFPNAEGEGNPECMCLELEKMGIHAAYEKTLGEAEHIFTHIAWEMRIHAFRLLEPVNAPWQMTDEKGLAQLPMPAAFRCARELAMRLLHRADGPKSRSTKNE